ncbi:hypothetical protein [Paraliobacillus ryukyuensis]|uniref:hypothetical protein n=1 Tax=Paraliobacillus ryukyuensis TaxID=200904 RepID=UPI0015C49462|nr:hypothetical protein [Paraliobacillus ryukyuensis]
MKFKDPQDEINQRLESFITDAGVRTSGICFYIDEEEWLYSIDLYDYITANEND